MSEQSKIKALEQKIRVLEEENLQLSERAEDSMLLGLIAPIIQDKESLADIFDLVLERISILKNIPYCTCGRFEQGGLSPIATYSVFSNHPDDGYPITFDGEIEQELLKCNVMIRSAQGLDFRFARDRFRPSAVALIPFSSQPVPDGVFLFAEADGSQQSLAAKVPLLQQVVDIAVNRVDNLYLMRALHESKEALEDRIAERTRVLSETNDELKRQIAEREKSEAEKNRYQLKLAQAQKMEAIGTLAGGIAHDFNNLMMGVQGHVSLLLVDKSAGDEDIERLLRIESLIKSATALTSQLLGIARKGKYNVEAIDPNDLIQKSMDLFGRTNKEVLLHLDLAGDILPIEVDRTQLEQVLLNICVNAWQAMPGGGELRVKSENAVLDEASAKSRRIAPGRYVKISLTDTGEGIDPAIQEKIFDPFFTTKDKTRGTGLGLASAYGIITNHNGIFEVHSSKGHGATFSFHLPATTKQPRLVEQTPAVAVSGSGTILLVDDEEIVRNVGQEMLTQIGYEVLVAGDGRQALDLFEQHQDRIAAVVLDMVMPGMSGGKVFDGLKKRAPRIKVLLSSGYSLDGEASEILARGCSGFIQKPFNLTDISLKLDAMLKR